MAIHVKEMTGAGYLASCTNEGYLQPYLSFCNSVSLEKNGETVLILRHQGGLPSTSAALVEKIRKGVFVFSGMSRKLDYDGLIFFHPEGKIEGIIAMRRNFFLGHSRPKRRNNIRHND